MKNKNLRKLALGYIWGLVSLLVTIIHDFHASARAIILLIGYCPIPIIHLKVAIGKFPWRSGKPFTVLTLLWCAEVILIIISEGLHLFGNSSTLTLDFITMTLFLIIALIVIISFLLNVPFLYMTTKSRTLVFVGIIGLLCTLWVATMISFSLIDLYWGHWSLITSGKKGARYIFH